MATQPSTDIVIYDVAGPTDKSEQVAFKPGRVFVDGSEVMTAERGVALGFDGNGCVVVTLRILPASLSLTYAPPPED